MKESDWKIGVHCGKCKEPIDNHEKTRLSDGRMVMMKFGASCPRSRKEFDPE